VKINQDLTGLFGNYSSKKPNCTKIQTKKLVKEMLQNPKPTSKLGLLRAIALCVITKRYTQVFWKFLKMSLLDCHSAGCQSPDAVAPRK